MEHPLHLFNNRIFNCGCCDKRYASKNSLKKHLLIHVNVKCHTCKVCGAKFRFNIDLKRHLYSHVGKKAFECFKCKKKFSRKKIMLLHRRIHDSKRAFRCHRCNGCFVNQRSLKQHRKLNLCEEKLKCRPCSKTFVNFARFSSHNFYRHSTHDLSKCTKCKKCFVTKPGLRQHTCVVGCGEKQCKTEPKTFVINNLSKIDTALAKLKLQFCCSTCPIAHNINSNVESKSVDRKLHQCNICEREFYSKNSLKLHNFLHASNQQHGCTYCYIKKSDIIFNEVGINVKTTERTVHEPRMLMFHEYLNKPELVKCKADDKLIEIDLLKEHEKLFHRITDAKVEKPFAVNKTRRKLKNASSFNADMSFLCLLCNRSFRSRRNLNIHLCNKGKKKFQCSRCPRVCHSIKNLKHHDQLHLSEKKYQCSLCSKIFVTRYRLRSHERIIHATDKTFTCKYCSKEFGRLWYLKLHEVIHIGERAYECKYCEKKFAWKDAAKKHERIHTGEKPYKCSQCESAFRTQSQCNSHFRRHHTQQPVITCPQCPMTFRKKIQLRVHLKEHNSDKTEAKIDKSKKRTFPCPFCCKHFPSVYRLKNHISRYSEAQKRMLTCYVCQKIFVSHKRLQSHELSHRTGATFEYI